MAWTAEQKAKILEELAKTGGRAPTADIEAFKTSIGVAPDDPNKTTSGTVRAGQMAEFEKAIQEGKSGAEFIAAPATFQQAQAPTAQRATQPITAPTAPMTTEQSLADQLAEAQKQATIAGLDKARQQSMLALSEEERAVQPQFAQQRSQARATSQRGAQSFAEFMAQRGLASSGASALGETQRLGALQGTLGGLQQQEQDVLANIGARRTGIEQAYQSDLASAQAGLEAQRLQNAIAQQAQQREQFSATAGQFAGDYKAQIDQVLGDNDPTNDWQADILGALRQQKIAELGLNQQGQPLQQGVQYTVSQALEATRQGLWNEAIANALGLPFTEQSRMQVTGGGGGSLQPTTTSPYGDAPVQQMAAYQELSQALQLGRLSGQEALNYLAKDYNTLVQRFGAEVVNKLAEDIQAKMQPVVAEPEPEVENTIALWATEYNTAPDKLAWLTANAQYMTDAEYKYFQDLISRLQ